VADDRVFVGVLVLFKELGSAGEGDLVDVLFDFFRGHADTVIGDRDGLGVFVKGDRDAVLGIVLGGLAERDKVLMLLDRVNGVGDDLADKDILVGIEPFFDDREQVFTVDGKRKSGGYYKTRAEAASALRDYTATVDKGEYIEPQKMPLSQWLQIWIDEY
jgi:hypothetical protein